jgi:hypothetical protein
MNSSLGTVRLRTKATEFFFRYERHATEGLSILIYDTIYDIYVPITFPRNINTNRKICLLINFWKTQILQVDEKERVAAARHKVL